LPRKNPLGQESFAASIQLKTGIEWALRVKRWMDDFSKEQARPERLAA
jgi:hypothetical protein